MMRVKINNLNLNNMVLTGLDFRMHKTRSYQSKFVDAQ